MILPFLTVPIISIVAELMFVPGNGNAQPSSSLRSSSIFVWRFRIIFSRELSVGACVTMRLQRQKR